MQPRPIDLLLAAALGLTACTGNAPVTNPPPGLTLSVPTASPTNSPTESTKAPIPVPTTLPTSIVIEPSPTVLLPITDPKYLAFGLDTPASELIQGTLPVSCLKARRNCSPDLKILHTGLPNGILAPATWSPDGKYLAFPAGGETDGFDVYVMDSSGGAPVDLTNSPESEYDVAWSPDGSTIAFGRDVVLRQEGQFTIKDSEIWLMQPDGRNPRRITGGCCMRWLPHNKGLVYLVFDQTTHLADLWITDVSGTVTHNLTDSPLREQTPVVSPNGRFLAYAAFDLNAEKTHLYLLDLEKSLTVDLTPTATDAAAPAFSPDSSQIAFVANSGEYDEHLFVMNVDQTGLSDLSQLSGKPATPNIHDTDPHWISDTQLVFISNRARSDSLYTINRNGTDLTQAFDPARITPGANVVTLSTWP